MALADWLDLLAQPFVWRALAVGVMVAVCAALLGVVLVMKGYAMIGHGLADVGFAALSIAVAFNLPPLAVSMPIVVAASFIIMAVCQNKNIQGDVAIGATATAALAIGVIVTATTRGFNIDVYNFMFGSILTMTIGDVWLSAALAVTVAGLYILFYNRIFLITCDEEFARTTGINVPLYRFLISFLTAVTIVAGMRMMGTLLISSLIIFPAITARKLAGGFKSLVVIAVVISVCCFIIGFVLSAGFNLPTGAGIAASSIVLMALVTAIQSLKRS